jgi:hypothetical protein
MNQPLKIRMKHMGSTAADLSVEYEIDEAAQVVELRTDALDSALVADFLESVLQRRHNIGAIRDDRTEWNPPRPPYRVFLTMHGQRYEVTAHRLMQGGGITVVLNPAAEDGAQGFIEDEYMKEKQARSAAFGRQVKLGLAKSTDASMFHGASKNSTVKYRNEDF